MAHADTIDFKERRAQLFIKFSEKSTLSEFTLRTRDRLLIAALVSVGLLSGAVTLEEVSAADSIKFRFDSILVMRISFGAMCAYLTCLLVAQSGEDFRNYEHRKTLVLAAVEREIAAMRGELLQTSRETSNEIGAIRSRTRTYQARMEELLSRCEMLERSPRTPEVAAEIAQVQSAMDSLLKAEMDQQIEPDPQPDLRIEELTKRGNELVTELNALLRNQRLLAMLEVAVPVGIGCVASLQAAGVIGP